MAGCKTWQGKLTWSFPIERVAALGERREAIVLKKKKKLRAGVKELKKQKKTTGVQWFLQQEEDNHLAWSQASLQKNRRTMESMQSESFHNNRLYF